MSAAFDQVTEAQRVCLRLVLTHHNSKEIAQIVGVSPSAVDKRLERAVQVLGASSRFAAARMLDAHEANTATSGEPVLSTPPPYSIRGTELSASTVSDPLPSELIDVAAEPAVAAEEPQSRPWGLARRIMGVAPTIRDVGGARNELRKTERLLLIGMLILVVCVLSVALLNMGQTLSSVIGKARAFIAH
ncbi:MULTISPECIES: sigma factor-like helix-turn-helix DNA-binding protein [unclassified Sphingomonas]|uniref:helix-turn-helix transcriptional regulator n=1 Tax=unclassified Sphingomonas TaxID=196159 RepID=UPI00226A4B6F|nr:MULTISPECIES: sigma factor-like helix-turn-helix DNA-binding protein [unclassified Sphingomonas]